MAETMIERAARALSAPGEPLPYHREMARGVIEAMREPTEAMVLAVQDDGEAHHTWRAMIDAALAE